MQRPLIARLERIVAQRRAALGLRMLLRAGWLAVCVWCVGLGCHLLWGWAIQPVLLLALSTAIMLAALLLVLRLRISPLAAARRLDRRFKLDEELATAVEVAAQPAPSGVGRYLLAHSEQLATKLERHI